jgi:WxL domain surface cell wall-binding
MTRADKLFELRRAPLGVVLTAGAVGLVATAAAVVPLVARAGTSANVTATATITGGTLAVSSSATPTTSVTLNGLDQTPTYTVPMQVTDPRGTGAGWNITLTSTTFTTGSNSLATNASAVTGATTSCFAGSTCTDASNSVGFPISVPAGASPPAANKIFDAALNTGMGELIVTPTVQVAIPANAYAGTYTSTLTLAVVTGP